MKSVVNDSAVLRAARRRIALGDNGCLCHAIDDCNVGTHTQKASLKRWVKHMIGKSVFYEDWLAKHHPDVYQLRRWDRSWRRLVRLKWLDWMIAYCEKEEAK